MNSARAASPLFCLVSFHLHLSGYKLEGKKSTFLLRYRVNVDAISQRRHIFDMGMWLVINRPVEKTGEKHNKHAARTMDCHLSFMIYSLVASCLFPLVPLHGRTQQRMRVPEC